VEDIVGARVAHDDAAVGSVCDNDTDGGCVEDGVEASFASAESFFGFFVILDVFKGAVPTNDFAVFVSSRGGACSHPTPITIAAVDTVLNVEQLAGTKHFFPCFECRKDIVGMEGANPAFAQRLLFGETGEGLPALIGIEDHAVGFRRPGDLRIEFDGVAIVVFAFGEGFFDLFAAGDIHERDGHADDLIDFVASGLKRDKEGTCNVRMMRIGASGLKFAETFPIQGAPEILFPVGELLRTKDIRDMASEVRGDGEIVYLCEAFVDADVAEVAIEEGESDGNAIINRVELGESLGGKSFKT
jgi:hypothetical protein